MGFKSQPAPRLQTPSLPGAHAPPARGASGGYRAELLEPAAVTLWESPRTEKTAGRRPREPAP